MPTDLAEQNPETTERVGRTKPKMKADVRRALMFHSLNTDLPHNEPSAGPDFLRERAALRLRTLRTFFCCRSFSTVFFTSSEKQDERTIPQLKLDDEEMRLTSASNGPRCLWLGPDNAHVDSEKRIWALGRTEVRGLDLFLCSQSPTIDVFRHWAEVMSTLEDLPLLDGVDFATSVFYDASWIVRPLQDFLPPNIAHRLKSNSTIMDRAVKSGRRSEEHPYVPPFFRLPARELEVLNWIPAMAANGPFERNEVVQKAIIHDELDLISYLDEEESWCVPGNEWSERQSHDYRTGFKNLRSLNDRFTLQILLQWMEYKEFADDQERLNALVARLVPLSAQIAGHAKEAGFSDVQLFAVLWFVRQTTECETYKRMLSATKQFVDDQPEFTITSGLDAQRTRARSDARRFVHSNDGEDGAGRTIFILQLARDTRPADLEEFFSSVGHVRDVRIITDSKTRRSKGIAYVEFWEREAVPLGLALNGQKLRNAPLVIQQTCAERNRLAAATVGSSIGFGPAAVGGPIKLWVSNLHPSISDDMLAEIFEPFGRIDRCHVDEQEDGQQSNRGYVVFKSADDGKKALSQLNGFDLAGRKLAVTTADDEPQQRAPSDRLDDRNINGGAGRLQLMAKLAEGSGVDVPQETKPGWDLDVRDDIILECEANGGVVHVYVDKQSEEGHVYMKCPTILAAHKAVLALHGRVFAGKVIAANFITAASYFQMFPEAQTLMTHSRLQLRVLLVYKRFLRAATKTADPADSTAAIRLTFKRNSREITRTNFQFIEQQLRTAERRLAQMERGEIERISTVSIRRADD
ncbi:hypothetical protein M3Y99_01767700 [Aphelenchoides fujianensis]|nr:hypothetical protein M3Y99_01767700 [Aphelenchoides fujianensis]